MSDRQTVWLSDQWYEFLELLSETNNIKIRIRGMMEYGVCYYAYYWLQCHYLSMQNKNNWRSLIITPGINMHRDAGMLKVDAEY